MEATIDTEINLIYFHFLGLEGAAALLCLDWIGLMIMRRSIGGNWSSG
jgi:hypothetical protein